PKYIQNYLSEYCWKFNRRYFGDKLFERLIITSINYKNEFRYNI
ncbi:MAG: IS1595 family transposase, partial [Bacteroidales bacterium]|nr:IS1595 family transposase [Bacteroidales bacterium]MBQ7280190.1 IS1595 family transposase [Bacteroidales bacterium]